jgi:PKD repeat protein
MRKLIYALLFLASVNLTFAQNYPNGMPINRTCGTQPPPPQWDAWLNQKVAEYVQNNASKFSSLNTSVAAAYVIPVIVHVLHGGQAVGTFPNMTNAQIVSQINILTNDFAGTGQYTNHYPTTAFANYATANGIPAPSYNGTRIIIGNAQLTFIPTYYDKNGNALVEPGVDRVNFNTFTLSPGFTSKDPANITYSTSATFQNFITSIVKPQTIWPPNKFMNIWVTDEYNSGAPSFNGPNLLGYATFPPGTGLAGLTGGLGTNTTDGLWCWTRAYGNTGFAAAPYNLGRTATHEIGHWVGLRHIWGDGNCLTDYCNDTPPASGQNFVNQNPIATPSTAANANTANYPYKANSCAGPPANGANGEMFMNFMDYSDDNAMYMFTTDQVTRLQTAMANSPIRNVLGTHGLTVPPPVANFSFSPTNPCAGQAVTVTDMSTGSPLPSAWGYSVTGATTSTSTLQNPVFTFTALGTQSITLIATANGTQVSLPVTKTITIGAGLTIGIAPSSTAICSGSSVTLTASGATTYTWNTGPTSAVIVVTPTTSTNYTVTGASGSCSGSNTIAITVTPNPTLTATSATICSGNSATLNASGATTYTWNPGGLTGASIVVSPSSSIIYTVTGANGTCNGITTAAVNVNTTPTVNVNASSFAICSGATTTLTASGATTYNWNTGATSAVIAVTPTANTTYTVTGFNGLCSNTKTITISVTSSPTVTATSATICSGNSATLTASGATTYTWNPGNLGGASVVLSPSTTTIYTVTGSNGGCNGTTTATVTVNATPTVNVNASSFAICSGATTTLTASGATTYNWNTGATSAVIAVTPTANTTYTVTGFNGLCSDTKTITISVTSSPTVTATSATICSGNSATLTASGATTYTWNPGNIGGASVVLSPSTTTIYTVTGSNGGCNGTTTATVTVNATPTVNVNASAFAICSGATTTLTASGATTYNWNTGATTAVIAVTPSVTTTYTVTGFNGTCSNTKTITISVTSTPTLAVNSLTICPGNTATVSASGATTYTWSTGSNLASIVVNPTVTTVYTVTGSNGSCNSSANTVTVTLGTGLSIIIAPSIPAICVGGSVNVVASGATTYTWSTGSNATNVTFSPSVTTVYTVSGTSGACVGTKIFTVTVTSNPSVSATPTNVTCFGACNGSFTPTGLGGTAPYTFTFAPSGPSNVCAGTYTILVQDAKGCTSSNFVAITQPTSLTAVTTQTNVSCNGGNNGTIVNVVSGGTPAYTYSWSPNSSSTGTATSLAAGVYSFTVKDANNCVLTKTAIVTQPSSLSIVTTQTNVSCNGGNNGTIVNIVSGGTPAYTYSWSPNSSTTNTATSLAAGVYIFTVKDANNCVATKTYTITQASALSISLTKGNTSCASVCNGTAVIVASGGTPVYNYLLTPSLITTPSATNLCAGTYTYSVIDNNSCSTSTVFTIGTNTTNPINVVTSNTMASCATCPNGTISALATGGNGALTYTWMPGNSTSPTVNNVLPNCYTVTVKDAVGCSANGTTCVTFATGLTTQQTTSSHLTIVPNPNTGEFMAQFENASFRTIEIVDALGRIVLQATTNQQAVNLNITNFANGIYYVKVSSLDGNMVLKMVKQ